MTAISHQQLWKTPQRAVDVARGGQHGHLVGGDVAEADVGEGEVARDGVDDQPVAIDRRLPEVEEDRDLDQLDDGVGQLGDPVGDEAKQEPALGALVDGRTLSFAVAQSRNCGRGKSRLCQPICRRTGVMSTGSSRSIVQPFLPSLGVPALPIGAVAPSPTLSVAPIQSDLFGQQLFQDSRIAAAVGLGDLGAQLALAALQPALLQRVQRSFDQPLLRCRVGVRSVVQRSGECARSSFVGCGVERVRRAGAWASASSRSAAGRSAIHSGCSRQRIGGAQRTGSDRSPGRTRACAAGCFSVSVSGSARCAGTLATRWAAACFSSCRSRAESMPSFCAASAANSSRWMGLGMRRMCGSRKFIAFTLASAVRGGKQLAGALDQVVGVASRVAQRRPVGRDALLADEAVGIEAAFERDDLDVEVLFGQQRDGFFGRGGARRVGVEVDDDALGEAAEQAHLHLRERGAGDGEHVLNPGHVDGDAVHLAFDQDRRSRTCASRPWPCRG